MNECNEWGVIYILDALALYQPNDAKEAEEYFKNINKHILILKLINLGECEFGRGILSGDCYCCCSLE